MWHYRMADREFGEWKARKLTRQLAALTANQQIQVHHGKKIVEVSAAQLNKGAAVAQVLAEEHPYDCVLCAGDDRTDESMFVLNTPGLLSVKWETARPRPDSEWLTPLCSDNFLSKP